MVRNKAFQRLNVEVVEDLIRLGYVSESFISNTELRHCGFVYITIEASWCVVRKKKEVHHLHPSSRLLCLFDTKKSFTVLAGSPQIIVACFSYFARLCHCIESVKI